ncbi:hypothetical protein Gotur_008515, partial [Gossypium turneri]
MLKNYKNHKKRKKDDKQKEYDFQSYKTLIEHWKEKFTTTNDQLERIEYLKLIEELYEKHKCLIIIMLKYDDTDSNQDEDIKVSTYNSDEETNSSEDEKINIPEPMDTKQTDPYGKRKIESDNQTDDYLRSLNKNFEIDSNTIRIFGNNTENIATTKVKPEYPGETSN